LVLLFDLSSLFRDVNYFLGGRGFPCFIISRTLLNCLELWRLGSSLGIVFTREEDSLSLLRFFVVLTPAMVNKTQNLTCKFGRLLIGRSFTTRSQCRPITNLVIVNSEITKGLGDPTIISDKDPTFASSSECILPQVLPVSYDCADIKA